MQTQNETETPKSLNIDSLLISFISGLVFKSSLSLFCTRFPYCAFLLGGQNCKQVVAAKQTTHHQKVLTLSRDVFCHLELWQKN